MPGRELEGFSLESGVVVLNRGCSCPSWRICQWLGTFCLWQGVLLASRAGALSLAHPTMCRTISPSKESDLLLIVLGAGLINLGVGSKGRLLGGGYIRTQTWRAVKWKKGRCPGGERAWCWRNTTEKGLDWRDSERGWEVQWGSGNAGLTEEDKDFGLCS